MSIVFVLGDFAIATIVAGNGDSGGRVAAIPLVASPTAMDHDHRRRLDDIEPFELVSISLYT